MLGSNVAVGQSTRPRKILQAMTEYMVGVISSDMFDSTRPTGRSPYPLLHWSYPSRDQHIPITLASHYRRPAFDVQERAELPGTLLPCEPTELETGGQDVRGRSDLD